MNSDLDKKPHPRIIETERLLLRPFNLEDIDDVYELNSNKTVQEWTGDKILATKEEARNLIVNVSWSDYEKYGFGRYAVVYKPDQKLIGFSGLKYLPEIDQVDLGYRFLPEYWGKGIATESSMATLKDGFENIELKEIIAFAYLENGASCHVLGKVGFDKTKIAPYPGEKDDIQWFSLRREKFRANF